MSLHKIRLLCRFQRASWVVPGVHAWQWNQSQLASLDISIRHFSATPCTWDRRKSTRDIRKNDLFGKFNNIVISVLEKWPFLRDYYGQMTKGFRRQYSDFKTWWSVRQKLNRNPGYLTTYEEHKAVFDVRGSAMKTGFLLPLFFLPMGIVIIFLPVTMFPQHILPHCYWSRRQRNKFFTNMNANRLLQHGLIFHHLTYLKNNHKSLEIRQNLEPIVKAMNGSGIPMNRDLFRLRDLCRSSGNPFNITTLPPALLSCLCHVNFLWKYLPTPWLAYYLNRRAILILEFDEKLRRENLVYDLREEELQDATFLRGLDCMSLTKEANQYWLKNWIRHTRDCTVSDASYVIHAMIFLSRHYNERKFQRRVFDDV